MKKILLLLAIAVTCSCTPQHPSYQVEVDSICRETFDRFVRIVVERDIEIDWSQIKTIEAVPLMMGMNGMYSTETRNIYMNIYFSVPNVIMKQIPENQPKKRRQLVEDAFLFVMAHEIAHSQGHPHIAADLPHLMNKNDRWMYFMIVDQGIETIIFDFFCPQEK